MKTKFKQQSSFDVNATLAEGIGNTQSLAAMAGAMRAGGINSDKYVFF